MSLELQTITVAGQRFVVVPEGEYRELVAGHDEPALPPADARGNRPAVASARVVLARQLLRRRKSLGWTQAELAKRAGVRTETVNRLESAKHSPNVATVQKLVRALERGERRK